MRVSPANFGKLRFPAGTLNQGPSVPFACARLRSFQNRLLSLFRRKGSFMSYYKRTLCRACDSDRVRLFLSLGRTPLANSFLRSSDDFAAEPQYPLDVYFCEGCSLVQLLDVVDPEILFGNYIYGTGTSETMAAHNVEYAQTLVGFLGLGRDDLVIELASNDGSLLKRFQTYGVRILGIEPARNIAEMARAMGI